VRDVAPLECADEVVEAARRFVLPDIITDGLGRPGDHGLHALAEVVVAAKRGVLSRGAVPGLCTGVLIAGLGPVLGAHHERLARDNVGLGVCVGNEDDFDGTNLWLGHMGVQTVGIVAVGHGNFAVAGGKRGQALERPSAEVVQAPPCGILQVARVPDERLGLLFRGEDHRHVVEDIMLTVIRQAPMR